VVTKEPYQTRLDPDDAGAVDDFAEDRGVTDAEALRRLVKAGLEAVDEDEADEDDDAETEKKPVPDGGYVTQSEFRRTISGLNVSLIVAAVYLGASSNDLLGPRATVAGGVLALVVLVASFVVGVGGGDE
jgi:hypothetical protein